MKKTLKLPLILIIIALLFSTSAKAGALEFGFTAGLSIPNEKISSFFNSKVINGTVLYQNDEKIDTLKSIGEFITKAAADLGYNFGIRLRAPISENFYLHGGVAFHRFNEGNYEIKLPLTDKNDTALANLKSTTNIVPINLGFTGYIIKKFIGIYALGDLNCNIISTSIDYDTNHPILDVPIATYYSKTRWGCGIGGGFDFDLSLFLLSLEAKYNLVNVIGRDENEPTKNFLNISLGITF